MLRKPTHDDIPHLVDLIEAFYKESKYAPDVDLAKVDRGQAAFVLKAYIEASSDVAYIKVIDNGESVVGLLIGERIPDLWTRAPLTLEILFYVAPEHRNRPSAGRILLDFAKWAEKVDGAIRVEATSGVSGSNAAKVYEKLGWGQRGTVHGTECY